MDDEDAAALAAAYTRVAGLRAALDAEGNGPVRCIETHISWVLLTPELVFKLKKPVRLPFLDFSTLAQRRHAGVEELRVNRRLAPSLYLDLVDVCDTPTGPRLCGGGHVVDIALRMRRFADGALWSERQAAGLLGADDIDALAGRLAAFHATADAARPGDRYGSTAVQARVTGNLVDAIDALQRGPGALRFEIDWDRLQAWLADQLRGLAPHWDRRLHLGRVRECHGDLHLANVVQLADGPTGFDGIEFDAELRWIDVLDDVAFPVMDLLAHREAALAHRLLNAWLEASGDYDGLPALRFYLVRRALVRALVAALRRRQQAAAPMACRFEDYLALAAALAGSADARLAITHGLPGSGKSFVSQRLLEAVGAIRARSDVERKRLFGIAALDSSRERVPGGIYDAPTTARTYARLLDIARVGLSSGWPTLIDAAFLRRAERVPFEALATSLAAPVSIVDCRAPLPLLQQRLARRQAIGGDASEADGAVLERLIGFDEPLEDDEHLRAIVVDAAQPFDAAAAAARWLAAR